MNISRLLSNASIREQILIGYLPVLLILAFVALTSYTTFNKFDTDFTSLSDVTQEHTLFVTVEKDMIELQRNVLVYSYVGYKGVLKKIDFLQDKIERQFDIIRPIADKDPEVGTRFDRMVIHYGDYKTGFLEAIQERNDLNTLYDEQLEPLIQKTHKMLDDLILDVEAKGRYEYMHLLSQVERGLLKADINVRSFSTSPDSSLMRQTDEILDDIKVTFERFRLDKLNLDHAEYVGEFLVCIDQYKSVAHQVSNANRNYLYLVNVVLAGKAAEIDTLSRELDALASERAIFFRQNIEQGIQKSRQHFILLSLIAGTIGLLCSIWVARGIANPVTAMARTLSDLSQENLNVTIPGQERKDEVGQMAKAAGGFQNMAIRLNKQGAQIQDNEARLSSIVDNMVDGLMTLDERGVIESYNHACEAIFGYPAEEIIGKSVKNLMPESYHDDFDTYIQTFNKIGGRHVLGAGERLVEGVGKVGRPFPIEVSVSQMELNNRKLYSAIVRDITERKTAEQDLLRANSELEEFAYRTSHDLRSPLVSSISLLSLADLSLAKGDLDVAQKSINLVNDSLVKLEALVKDILALAQSAHGDHDIEEISIEDIIEQALKKLDHMDHYDRLNIKTDLVYSGFKSSVNRVTLVLENLISNAIKYQDLSKESSFIKISAHQKNGRLYLSVEDNGLGVPENMQDQLFTMFKRFHPKTAFGSGLGLYMMKKSIEMIGGSISYDDTGDGSRFNVDFINEA